MGQSWYCVNIDRGESTDTWWKMGEFFFAKDPARLIAAISVPANASLDYKKPETGNGSWAGDRIMVIGDYTEEWPQRVLEDERGDCFRGTTPYEYALTHMVGEMDSEWVLKFNDQYPTDRPWVLRNLDKKVYVSSDGIPTVGRDGRTLRYYKNVGPFSAPGLGSVLVGKIGWSQDPSCAMEHGEDYALTQGGWVGDRFDARVFDEVKDQMEAEGWTDVTNEEAIRTRGLW
ncbi:hypothetical protein CPC08DRAFT_822202, partial [Agrocybe pediades]